ncbi:MAG TPA: hypothetical protein VGE13_01560 [Candidatus Saccharimonadales bacterium]
MMQYLRLLFLIPMLRSLMLYDISMMKEGDEPTQESGKPDFTELDELVKLHAKAVLHMNALGWPVGSIHQIRVGYKPVKGPHWWSRTKQIPIYEDMFGASTFAGLHIMRSGAIYQRPLLHECIGHSARKTWQQLDLVRIDQKTRRHLIDAFEYILDMTPQPVYIP